MWFFPKSQVGGFSQNYLWASYKLSQMGTHTRIAGWLPIYVSPLCIIILELACTLREGGSSLDPKSRWEASNYKNNEVALTGHINLSLFSWTAHGTARPSWADDDIPYANVHSRSSSSAQTLSSSWWPVSNWVSQDQARGDICNASSTSDYWKLMMQNQK